MNCSCIVPLTPTVIVMRGFIFHSLFYILLINGSYLACLCMRACSGNLLWQFANWMNCIVYVGACSKCSACGLGLLVYLGYLVLIWLGIGNLFVGMYISWAIMGQLVRGSCYWGCIHWLVCRIRCVCWLIMFEWWGAPLCCGEQLFSLLDRGVSHIDSRWGHVSLLFLWHNVQLGFGSLRGQKMFFLWLPMYWAYIS